MLYFLPIAAAVGVIAVIGVAVIAAQQSQHHQGSRYSPNENYVPTPRPLAPCADCHGILYEYNGTTLSCGHTIHFTCLQDRRRNMREYLHGDKCCPICFPDNQVARRRHNGSTNRSPQPKKCAVCPDLIRDELYTKLECQTHIVHDTCWANMQKCNLTVCVICSPKQAPQQVTSLTTRSSGIRECANCEEPIADDPFKKLQCQKHRVHITCWERMVESNLTGCSICYEEGLKAEYDN